MAAPTDLRHVVLVTDDFPPVRGGIARLLRLTASCLPADRIRVFAADCAGAAEFDSTSAIAVSRFRFRAGTSVLTLVDTLLLAPKIIAALRSNQDSILYLGNVWPFGLVGLIARALGFRYVVHIYGLEVLPSRGRIIESLRERILRNASHVIAISRFTRDLALSRGVVSGNLSVVCPCIDPKPFQIDDPAVVRRRFGMDEKRVLLTVCRLYARKGVDRVIEALPNVLAEFPDALYVVVGNGPDLPRLEALAARKGVAHAVRFVTDCGDDDLVRYYHACDVFLMISRYIKEEADVEGFGIVYLEANACRKPVIAGNSGGVPDAVEDNVSGLLVDPESADEVAGAILRLFRDPAMAARLGQQGYERLHNELGLEVYAAQIQSVIRSVR
ncbi:MAG: glycosyltransferase family 4 protein [Candidatus Hydrogenedentes bacterium]|nr:glycosyltransferase family 4 protein [Candidatus Hydrogenedentota bacterium]